MLIIIEELKKIRKVQKRFIYCCIKYYQTANMCCIYNSKNI